jgi:hypothetical protein
MTITPHIRWEISPGGKSILGYAGTLGPWAFQIWTAANIGQWCLITQMPGMADLRSQDPDPEALKAEAEKLLAEFVTSLGAIFPNPEAEGYR